jgi:hypothetical protein
MKAGQVSFGTQIVQFKADGGKQYIRVNTSRNVVEREEHQTVFVNVANGRVRIISKEADAYLQSNIVAATSAAVRA